MADTRLRELERLAAQGDLQARSRLLHERARARGLTGERLLLAAYLGDAASREAVGEEGPSGEGLDLAAFVLGLKPFGPDVFVRAGVAAASLLTPKPAVVVDALQAWLMCPCEDHARVVRAAARTAELGGWDPRHVGGVTLVARLATPRPARRVRSAVHDAARGSSRGCWSCPPPQRRGRYATTAANQEEVRRAIVAALLDWALAPTR